MATNWPPATAPAWPPRGQNAATAAGLEETERMLAEWGFTNRAPTAAETNTFFKNARCVNGHAVVGRMLDDPQTGLSYPFAVCNNATDRMFLVLWSPFEIG